MVFELVVDVLLVVLMELKEPNLTGRGGMTESSNSTKSEEREKERD